MRAALYFFPYPVFLRLSASAFSPAVQNSVTELTQDHREFAFSLYPVLDASRRPISSFHLTRLRPASRWSMSAPGAIPPPRWKKRFIWKSTERPIAKTSSALAQSLLLKKKEENSYQLNIANAIWVDQGTFCSPISAMRSNSSSKLNSACSISPNLTTLSRQSMIGFLNRPKVKSPISSTANDINAADPARPDQCHLFPRDLGPTF